MKKRISFIVLFSSFLLSCHTQQQGNIVTSAVAQTDGAVRTVQPMVGKVFPLFRERDLNGRLWTYRDIEGHATVFYIWNQGTVQCLTEMNELSAWKAMYPGVMFFSVSSHDSSIVRRVGLHYNFTWIHLCNVREMITWVTQGTTDEKGHLDRSYPLTIVVDREGVVRHISRGTGIDKRQAVLDAIRQYQ